MSLKNRLRKLEKLIDGKRVIVIDNSGYCWKEDCPGCEICRDVKKYTDEEVKSLVGTSTDPKW